jgi:L-alanine-DL-glutamate epimerase-like enolase superfamily enzyme
MEPIVRDVTALDSDQRRSLETLLGHELSQKQRLYVAVLPNFETPTPEKRQQALAKLREATTQIEVEARRRGMTPEAWAAIVQTECDAVRAAAGS